MTFLSAVSWIIFIPTLLLYTVSGALLSRQFFSNDGRQVGQSSRALALRLMILACFGHALFIFPIGYSANASNLAISEVAAVLSFIVTFTMLVMNRYLKNTVFLPAVCGLSALFLIIYFIAPDSQKIAADMSFGLVLHIILSIFALGALSLSFIYALQLTYISHQLKNKKLVLASNDLPPLLSVELILAKLMISGTILLLIALSTGFMFVPNMFADGYAHKTLLSLIAFCVYAIAIGIHKKLGLKSRVLAFVNFIGIALLILAYFGSRIVAEVIL